MANTLTNNEDLKWNTSGVVLSFSDGVAIVNGLTDAAMGEMVDIHGVRGLILNIEPKFVKVVVFADDSLIYQGDVVIKLNDLMLAPVGWTLLGKTVDILGNRLDVPYEPIEEFEWAPADIKAPGIIMREPIRKPLETGILAIDSMIPVGRGQRELIIGDRNTGKTTIAVDTIINHAGLADNLVRKLYCIYVAVGIRRIALRRVLNELLATNSYDHTTLLSATASDPASMQYIAPYVGCAMGEFFRDNQRHALVIYDDLSKHAVAYRQMSLLLRRPPGREAYPGDIFYLHSRLLERAAKLKYKYGGGSLSAFPVIETQSDDVSAYIPTNVISITDGQIYLEAKMFRLGVRPAVNVGLSVSRIGSNAQTKLMKFVTNRLKLNLSTYRTFELFKSLGSDIDEYITAILCTGERIIEILIQPSNSPMCQEQQAVLIYAVQKGYLNLLELDDVDIFKSIVSALFKPTSVGIRKPFNPSVAAIFQKIFKLKNKLRANVLFRFYRMVFHFIWGEERYMRQKN